MHEPKGALSAKKEKNRAPRRVSLPCPSLPCLLKWVSLLLFLSICLSFFLSLYTSLSLLVCYVFSFTVIRVFSKREKKSKKETKTFLSPLSSLSSLSSAVAEMSLLVVFGFPHPFSTALLSVFSFLHLYSHPLQLTPVLFLCISSCLSAGSQLPLPAQAR
jgi:hypothetical protein